MAPCSPTDYVVTISLAAITVPMILICVSLTRIIAPRKVAIAHTKPSAGARVAECLCCGQNAHRNAIALKPGFVVSLLVQILIHLWRRGTARSDADEPPPRRCCRCRLHCCCPSFGRLTADSATLRVVRARLLSVTFLPCRRRVVTARLLAEVERFVAEVQARAEEGLWADPLFRSMLIAGAEALRRELQQGESRLDVLNLSVDMALRVLALPELPKTLSRLGLEYMEMPRWLSRAFAGRAEAVLAAVLCRLQREFWEDHCSRVASVLRLVVADLVAFRMLRQVKTWPVLIFVVNIVLVVCTYATAVGLCGLWFRNTGDVREEVALRAWAGGFWVIAVCLQVLVPTACLLRMSRQLVLTLHWSWSRTLGGLMERSVMGELVQDMVDVAVDEVAVQAGFLLGEPIRKGAEAMGGSAYVLARLRAKWPKLICSAFDTAVPGAPRAILISTATTGAYDGVHRIQLQAAAMQANPKRKRDALEVAAERFYAAASDAGRARLALRKWMLVTGHAPPSPKPSAKARARRMLSSSTSRRLQSSPQKSAGQAASSASTTDSRHQPAHAYRQPDKDGSCSSGKAAASV